MLIRWSLRRLARDIAVGSTSFVVLVAAASYALAPASEAIGITATAVKSSRSAVEGRVVEGRSGAKGVKVEVLDRVRVRRHGRWVSATRVVGEQTVRTSGRFRIGVRPGRYIVVLRDRSGASKTLHVTVRRGRSIFVAASIKRHAGVLSIAPVIFNY